MHIDAYHMICLRHGRFDTDANHGDHLQLVCRNTVPLVISIKTGNYFWSQTLSMVPSPSDIARSVLSEMSYALNWKVIMEA